MRRLATIRIVSEVNPIDNADFIEVVKIQGWQCVAKKGDLAVGDLVVYFEIDSLLPEWPQYEFLRKSSWMESLGRYRLKTARLRGVLSQGLVLPISLFEKELPFITLADIDRDITSELNVLKYEPPIHPSLFGKVRPYDWAISKTDEERIQNLPTFVLPGLRGYPYYITSKLDGTSASFISGIDEEGEWDYHVCSRNLSLVEDNKNLFWQMSQKYCLRNILYDHFLETNQFLALQGEICGPGIQGNKLGLSEHKLFIFNAIKVGKQKPMYFTELSAFCNWHNLDMVPIIEAGFDFPATSQEEILRACQGTYISDGFEDANPTQQREGWVVRSRDMRISFKAINNEFLLQGGN